MDIRTVFIKSPQEIKNTLSFITKRCVEDSAGEPPKRLGAVLVGSRAALQYDRSFRLWRHDEDGDWDVIITIGEFWTSIAPRLGLQPVLRATVLSTDQSGESGSIGKNEAFLDLTVTVTVYGGAVLEYEIVDPTLSVIKNQSGLMLLDIVNNQTGVENITLPSGTALCCPLQLLIALKRSHILFPIKWKKHTQDLEKLKPLAETLKLPYIDGLDALVEIRRDETGMRMQGEYREAQYEAGLVEPVRHRLASIFGLDGSHCFLERELSFNSLSKDEMFAFVEMETAVLLLASLPDPDEDLSLVDLARPAELLATSNEYCSSARLFLVDNFSVIRAKLRSRIAKHQGELSTALAVALSEFLESSDRRKTFLSTRRTTAATHQLHAKNAFTMPDGPHSTSCILPLDVLFEILVQSVDALAIGRIGLSEKFLGTLLLGEQSNKLWKRICEHSFRDTIEDSREVRGIQPKYDGEEDLELALARSVDWRQFHIGQSLAAKLRVPGVNTLPKCSPRLIFCDAARHSGRKQVSLNEAQFWAEQPCLGKEIQFILKHSTITGFRSWHEADKYDDPAWKIMHLQLHCVLPSLKHIVVTWQVKEDLRFYVPGDSKTDDDWRPVTRMFDEAMTQFNLSAGFNCWIWVVLLLSNCPDGKRLGKILGISVR